MARYRIEIPHFYCLEYYESNKVMRLDIDFRDRVIYLSDELVTKWLPPNEDIELSKQDKKLIIRNIYKELLKNSDKERIVLEDAPPARKLVDGKVFEDYGIKIFIKGGKYYLEYDSGELASSVDVFEVSEVDADRAQKSEDDAYQVVLKHQMRRLSEG